MVLVIQMWMLSLYNPGINLSIILQSSQPDNPSKSGSDTYQFKEILI
jgi:hypothetical protein